MPRNESAALRCLALASLAAERLADAAPRLPRPSAFGEVTRKAQGKHSACCSAAEGSVREAGSHPSALRGRCAWSFCGFCSLRRFGDLHPCGRNSSRLFCRDLPSLPFALATFWCQRPLATLALNLPVVAALVHFQLGLSSWLQRIDRTSCSQSLTCQFPDISISRKLTCMRLDYSFVAGWWAWTCDLSAHLRASEDRALAPG